MNRVTAVVSSQAILLAVSSCQQMTLPDETRLSSGLGRSLMAADPVAVGEPVPDLQAAYPTRTDAPLPEKPSGIVSTPIERVTVTRSNPTYEKPSAVLTDAILSDEKFHAIAVLFKDEVAARALRVVGDKRSDYKIASDNGTDVSSVEAIFQKWGVEIAPLYPSTEFLSRSDLEREQQNIRLQHGITMSSRASWVNVHLRDFTTARCRDLLDELNRHTLVRVAEVIPNPVSCAVNNYTPPTDPKFPQSGWSQHEYKNTSTTDTNFNAPVEWYWWNRHSIGGAWSYGTGSGVKIAVIDNAFQSDLQTEITYDQDLKRRFYGVSSEDNHVEPDSGSSPLTYSEPTGGYRYYHGTFCASLAAGKSGNNIQLCGVAPNAKIVPLRAFTGDQVFRAIDYARLNGIKIISLSLNLSGGMPGNNPENYAVIRDQFLNYYTAGGNLFYAAGNTGANVSLPINSGDFTNAVFVGGVDKYNNYLNYSGIVSSHGPRVDIAAAGEQITSTVNYIKSGDNFMVGNGSQADSGTSFSTPLVAGTAAILRQYVSSPLLIRNILIGTSDIACAADGGSYNPDTGVLTVGTYSSEYQMSSNKNGTEGWSKIRVLNAKSAAALAYKKWSTGNRYLVHRPASIDYTEIKRVDGTSFSVGGWYPANLSESFSPTASLECWTYKNGSGLWAASTSVLDGNGIGAYQVYGAPALFDSLGHTINPTWSSQGSGNGWLNKQSFTLTSSGVL